MIFATAALVACIVTSPPQTAGVATPPPATDSARAVRRADPLFRPDYAHALTVEQMLRAWNDELDRISPPPATGGG